MRKNLFCYKAFNLELNFGENLLHNVIGKEILEAFRAREKAILQLSGKLGTDPTQEYISVEKATAFVDGYIKKVSDAYSSAEVSGEEDYHIELEKAKKKGAQIFGSIPGEGEGL